MKVQSLRDSLGLSSDQTPFPWQQRFLEKLVSGVGNQLSLDVPTGLGKTSAMAAWLVARAGGADLPRRLVYIVDRRAVVDQATREAERLREWVRNNKAIRNQLGLADGEQLAISTLRGHFADNREWLSSPSAPAIVVGTVDMVGSRLLFEGYGVSRRMRPYHAGFLGADSLFVLDEAHLVPPFEALLETIVSDQKQLVGKAPEAGVKPRCVLLSLSATGRIKGNDVLRIDDSDQRHCVAGQRLRAVKRLEFVPPCGDQLSMHERLAQEAWKLSKLVTEPKKIIVFCASRDTAVKAEQSLRKLATREKVKPPTQLFVGARRVRERQTVEHWLEKHGFLAGLNTELQAPSFVFSTSAGEVGVDLDADHMVGDLVAFERMVQRFGRVNRRGGRDACIRILLESEEPNKQQAEVLKKALSKSPRERNAGEHIAVQQFDLAPKYRTALQSLPCVEHKNAVWDASPNAFRELKLRAEEDGSIDTTIQMASTHPPLRPELTRPVLDAWSMTSLEEHAGRTNVAPWLRGWVEDKPQLTVVWRNYLPTCSAGCNKKHIEEFFEAAPIHLTEKLELNCDEAFKHLMTRIDQLNKLKAKPGSADEKLLALLPGKDEIVAIVVARAGGIVRTLTFAELSFGKSKERQSDKRELNWQLRDRTIVLDARLGGLHDGLFAPNAKNISPTIAIDGDGSEGWITKEGEQPSDAVPIPAFRIRIESTDDAQRTGVSSDTAKWKDCFRMPIVRASSDEPSEFLVISQFRKSATSEASRSTTGSVSLEQHHRDTEVEIAQIAESLGLPDDLKLMLRIAARNHDHGKNTEQWQNAFSAPASGRPYAKTDGPFRNSLLSGYRHEFGSLPFVSRDPEFRSLEVELQELALHLVAAHHGYARPVVRTTGCNDAPPSALQQRAREVAVRFERAQKNWGPWGLAWLESLLRAADQRASAELQIVSAAENSSPRLSEKGYE